MTISSEIRTAGPFSGNGVTNEFPFDFKVFKAEDLYVVVAPEGGDGELPLELGTDYTVVLNPDQNAAPGGKIVAPSPLPVGFTLTATSSLAYLQPVDLTNQGGFYPRVINDGLDRLTIFVQQLFEGLGRSLKVPLSDGPVRTTLPGKNQRANRLLSFNELGEPTATEFDIDELGHAAVAARIAADEAKRSEINAVDAAGRAEDAAEYAQDAAELVGRQVAAVTPTVQRFSGDGVTASFELSVVPGSENNTQVYISGVYQQKDTYEIDGVNLIFSEAPPEGDGNIEVVIAPNVMLERANAQDVVYTGPDGLVYSLQDLSDPDKGAAMVARGVVAVDSIADLLALPAGQRKEGLRYLVKGYHPPLNYLAQPFFGGGVLYWDAARSATEHNGVSIFDPARTLPDFSVLAQVQAWVEPSVSGTGCFVRILPDECSMHMAGLVGDDTAEESPLATAALEAFAGKKVYWPAPLSGSYRVSFVYIRNPITLEFSPDCVLRTPLRITASGGLHRFLDIRDTRGVVIKGGFAALEMDNPLYESEYSHGISITSTSDVHIDSLHVSDARGDGIYIGGETACENIKIDQVYCYGSRRQGLSITHARHVYVSNSRFSASLGINPQSGVVLEANPGQVVEDCHFDSCRADGNGQNGFIAGVSRNCTFTNCHSSLNAGGGFNVIGGSADIKFFGCTSKMDRLGFYLNNAPDAVLDDCKVLGTSLNHGIQVLGSPGAEVVNCEVRDAVQRGITIASSLNSVISGCRVHGNGQQGVYIGGSEITCDGCRVYNNVGDNIYLFTGIGVKITNNWIRKGANLSPSGISVRNSTNVQGAFVNGNDCRGGGESLGIYLNPAQGTAGHNINNDGTYSTTPN